MAFSTRWVLADGTLNDQLITIRYRESVQSELDCGQYQQCIQISWQASEQDPVTGYPSSDELEKIDDFNQKLMDAVEIGEHGLLVMVLMCEGINQWIIYAKDNEQLQQALNTIPTDTGLYPIEVASDEDPQWETFIQLRDAIKTQ
jgi:hypothetical protein